jgi:hypothetical protein
MFGDRAETATPRAGIGLDAREAPLAPGHAPPARDASGAPSPRLVPATDGAPPRPRRPSLDESAPTAFTGRRRPASQPDRVDGPALRPAPPPVKTARAERGATEPHAEPTIHVTIGRIDVRAVMPAPSAPTRPAVPVEALSLEDYLRRGTRGSR